MPNYRQNFFRIFAIFFVIAVPFIVVYSLGFDLNLANRQLGNTISINIQTLPRGAAIINQGQKILETPQELKAKDDQIIPLEIKLDGYKNENFLIWASPNQNTSARITRLSLLPENNDQIANFEDAQNVTFLSSSFILLEKDNKFFVQLYSFSGLQGNSEAVKLNGAVSKPKSSKWQPLSSNSFWNPVDNLVLNRAGNDWNLTNLNIFPNNFTSIVKLEESTFLGLDNSNILWQLNLESNNFTYLESNIQNLTSTRSPNNIWIRKDNNLIRLNRTIQDGNNFILTDKIYSNFPQELVLIENKVSKWKSMTIKTLSQGLLIQLEENLYYIPDYNPTEWFQLADNAKTYQTSGNSVFWVDNQNVLNTYNLYLKEWNIISTLDIGDKTDDLEISYYSGWNRLLVYTPESVIAVWFDKEIYNKNILGYYPVNWIKNANCNPEVIDKYQFCIQNNKLITYKNLSFW